MKIKNLLLPAVLLTLVVLSLSHCGKSLTPEQQAEADCKNKLIADLMAKKFMRDSLKSPSTAEFSGYTAAGTNVKYLGNCKHQVLGYVDAQNSFGAMIRTTFLATVQMEKETRRWALLEIETE